MNMNKIITLVAFTFLIGFLNAQVFFENWDNAQAWTTNDADGDLIDWQLTDFTGTASNLETFGSSVFSASWDENTFTALTPDNFLFSPLIDLSTVSGSLTLQYDVASVDPDFPFEFYTLYIFTDINDFGTAVELHSETILIGDQIFNRTFDISAFAGQPEIYIAFRHHNSTDNFRIAFDNIGVYNADFVSDAIAGTVCRDYVFTDNSLNATAWDWDFGDGATPQTANTQGPHTVSYSTPGLKTITLITHDGLVSETNTDLINVSLLDDASFSFTQTNYCVGSANESAVITGFTGGIFTSTTPGFVLDATTGEIDLSNFAEGTYEVTYTTEASACQNSSTVSVTIERDNATFSYSQANFCVGSANEAAQITGVTGGTFSSPTPGLILDASTGEIDLSTFPAATYDITYTTPVSACQNSSTLSIEIGLDDATFNYSNTDFCFGAANEIAVITGVMGGTFTSPTAGFVVDDLTGEIALSSFAAGTYDVTYSTPAGVCQNSTTVSVTIFDQFITDPIPDQELCAGGMTNAINFTGSGSGIPGNTGLDFEWEYTTVPANTNIGLPFTGTGNIPSFQVENTTASPVVATFTITPTDGTCGGTPITFTITVNPQDNAMFSYAQLSNCLGSANQTPDFIATFGGIFSSTTLGFVDAITGEISISTFPVASYDVSYMTNGTCPNMSSLTIDIISTSDASFSYSSTTFCQDDTNPTATSIEFGGTFSSNLAGLVFADALGTVDLAASTPGTYSVTYTTGGNCGSFSTSQVVINEVSMANQQIDLTFCEGQNVNDLPFTGSAATQFSWTNSNTDIGLGAAGLGDLPSFITANGTGASISATIEVTPDNGVCPGNPMTFTITINTTDDPSFTLSSPSACSGTPNVTATIDGTIGGTFSSTPGLTINPADGQINLATSIPGLYVVTYQVGAGTCQTSSTQDFELIQTPVLGPAFDVEICSGQIVPNLNLDVLSPFSIEWTNDNINTGIVNVTGTGDIPSFIATNPTLGAAPEVSTITLTAENNGCFSAPSIFTVTVNSNPVVNAGNNVTQCEGLPLTMTATGTPGTIFTWDNNITQGQEFNPIAGTFIYTATGTLNGCTSFDQVNVNINVTPQVSAGADRVVCAGTQTVLTGSGALIMTWDNGVFDNIPFVPTVSGDYVLTGQNGFGCISRDTVEVVVEDLPTPSFTTDLISGCRPTTVIFNSNNTTNGCVYSFSDGSTEIGCFNVAHTFTQVGTYDVTLTQVSINQCVGQVTIPALITINPDPVASFTAEKEIIDMIDPTNSFINTSIGAIEYEWNFGDNSGVIIDENPFHSFPADAAEQFQIRLIAISPFGCRDTAYRTIQLEESVILYIPNSFTPNGDEYNNHFTPKFFSGLDPQSYNMKIFNRFGELIFESRDPDQGWDGDYGAGRGLTNTGVYTFKIEYSTSSKDEKKMVVGSVTLLR